MVYHVFTTLIFGWGAIAPDYLQPATSVEARKLASTTFDDEQRQEMGKRDYWRRLAVRLPELNGSSANWN
jgi:hypothetical protein